MHIEPLVVFGSAIVGLLVGLTGAGGGALMTPMLILLFGVRPAAAISSDLVAAVLMRPAGALVHLRRGTVNLRLAGWMALGSVPMAVAGAYVLRLLGGRAADQRDVEAVLGAALIAGAAAMIVRGVLGRRPGRRGKAAVGQVAVRPAVTVAIGALGGLLVGMTSVGAGSLMIVLLLFAYPALGASQLVGTDLAQAVPLSAAAALGALAFGRVELAVTVSVALGSVPAALLGSLLSSRAPDRFIRPALTAVMLATGLKYVGVGTAPLGASLAVLALGAAAWRIAARRPGRPPAAGRAEHEPLALAARVPPPPGAPDR